MDAKLKRLLEAIADLGTQDLYTDDAQYETRVASMQLLCALARHIAKGAPLDLIDMALAEDEGDAHS